MSEPDAGSTWQIELRPLLDAYLHRVGIESAEVRARWMAHVFLGLQMHLEEFVEDDYVEQAVERLRQLIDARLARVTNLDPVHQRGEIAGVLALLGMGRYAALVNSLFEDYAFAIDPAVRAQLLHAIAIDRPQPVPRDAPLAMPTQTVRLRSARSLRRLFRRPG